MRRALLACGLLLCCQREPSRSFEEFPPPRLAKAAANTLEGERFSIERGQAHLSLRNGRQRSRALLAPVTGWLELDGFSQRPLAGELAVDLSVLRYADGSAVREVSGLRPVDAEPLRLTWDAAGDGWTQTATIATLTVNRHRSELQMSWTRERKEERHWSLTSRRASVPLRGHGLSPRFERKDGTLVPASEMQLSFTLDLEAVETTSSSRPEQ